MTTFEKVANILAEYKDIDVSAVKEDTSFTDLGFDSLDTVELVMQLEDAFEVAIEMSPDLKTVKDLIKIIDGE